MHHRSALKLSTALLLATIWQGLNSAEPVMRPNFLFILADDVTYNTIGCYGGSDAKTPAIDKLASEGIRFTRAYAATSMCAPFRAELYTGLYPVRNGVSWNHSQARRGTKSICHYLSAQGYRVGLAGKKHADPASVFPFEEVGNFPAGEGVREFITRSPEPFCLFLCSNNAHAPWTTGDPSHFNEDNITLAPVQHDNARTREVMTRYLAEVEDLDREVGEILDLLDNTGKADNTLVMFSSEQGWALGFAKWSNWDLGLRTALLARWPGKIRAGTVSNALIQVADIVPTFLETAGVEQMPEPLDGRSFSRYLLGADQPMREYVYGIHNNVPEGPPYPIRSIRDKNFHYILNLRPEETYHVSYAEAGNSRLVWWLALKEATEEGDEKAAALLVKWHTRPAEELYKVDDDPYETNNLASDPGYSEIKARLRAELMRWMDEQGDTGAEMDHLTVYSANRDQS